MKNARVLGILLLLLLAGTVRAQRLQFATPIGGDPPATAGNPGAVPFTTSTGTPSTIGVPAGTPTTIPQPNYGMGTSIATPGAVTPMAPQPSAVAPGLTPGTYPGVAPGAYPGISPSPGVTTSPGIAPTATVPLSPGVLPGPAPGPQASFQGGILPPPSWDPYAPPGTGTTPLFSSDPALSLGPGGLPPATKLLQDIRLSHTWLAGPTVSDLGVNESQISATFAFPLFHLETPFLITPGFGIEMWDGPVTLIDLDPKTPAPDLPPRTYDAYLDTCWNPQITPWLGAELGARVGVYSDFTKVVSHSIRVQGHGLAVLSFSPSFQIKAGAIYADRNKIKLLPAGGVVWTPSSDTKFEILFPNPRFSHRLATLGTADWWWYLRGEYGGGAWTVRRAYTGDVERIDYNDIRVALGLEFISGPTLKGYFEVGGAFNREVLYVESPNDNFKPGETFFLGAGVAF